MMHYFLRSQWCDSSGELSLPLNLPPQRQPPTNTEPKLGAVCAAPADRDQTTQRPPWEEATPPTDHPALRCGRGLPSRRAACAESNCCQPEGLGILRRPRMHSRAPLPFQPIEGPPTARAPGAGAPPSKLHSWKPTRRSRSSEAARGKAARLGYPGSRRQ
jgi:hypothetical protein